MTQKEIADILGVSEATVSLALRDNEKVSPKTRDRVKHLAELTDYRPNFSAQSLALGKTRCIGVIVSDISDVFYSELVQELHRQIRSMDYIALCLPSVSIGTSHVVDTLLCRRVDGIISMSLDISLDEINKIRNSRTPIIYYEYTFATDSVRVDMVKAGKILTRHLIQQGCRKIAFIGKPSIPSGRYSGYIEALAENNVKFREELTKECPGHYSNAYNVAKELFSQKNIPDAVVCFNDVRATGALRAILDMGFKVPEDIAVAGVDDIMSSAYAGVPLTTVNLPREEIVSELLKMLFRKIEAGAEEIMEEKVIQPRLVVRASSLRKNQ
ncbi:MAG: hypothetical protein A2017_19670 [Lentisphaerae bacterium GWF2_44_16]|nr:MAG: hypothetical protein A2017_19670 [Lentisphaerae bacterium GWF2_44_16]